MTQYPISAIAPRMGRPPLNVKPVLVRLHDGIPERIDAIVGKNKRAEFIRDAVDRELERRESGTKNTSDGGPGVRLR